MTASPRCVICHRALKTVESVRLGIGPHCAKKTGVGKTTAKRVRKYAQSKASCLGTPLFAEAV